MWTEIARPKRTWSPTVIVSWSPLRTVRAPILTPRPRVTLPITNPSGSISTSSPTVGSVLRYGTSGIGPPSRTTEATGDDRGGGRVRVDPTVAGLGQQAADLAAALDQPTQAEPKLAV